MERERGVTLVLIFLCAYVLHRRKKHQRNTIRLRSHRIPLFQNELGGMTPSQPRSPRLQFPFLFECTKIYVQILITQTYTPDRKTSTTRSARRLVAHRAIDDAAAALKKDACMTLIRRTTSLAGARGLYDCRSRAIMGRVFSVPGTLRDIAAPRRLEGLRFCRIYGARRLAFKKAPRRCHLGPVHSYPK